MDREKGQKITDILQKFSPREQMSTAMEQHKLTYSVVGFISASDFTDTAILISNLSYLLSQEELNICVVDFKVFSPNLYQYLDAKQNIRGRGLLSVLKGDKSDFRDELTQTKYKDLYLLSPSPHDLMEEYFDFDFKDIENVLDRLKSMFDLVLIDIPNIPPLEFCVAAIKYCSRGFFVASERIDASNNMTRLLDFVSSLGISTGKFSNVIFMNLQNNSYDFNVVSELNFNIVSKLPLVNKLTEYSYVGNLYINESPFINKYFIRELNKIKNIIIEQS